MQWRGGREERVSREGDECKIQSWDSLQHLAQAKSRTENLFANWTISLWHCWLLMPCLCRSFHTRLCENPSHSLGGEISTFVSKSAWNKVWERSVGIIILVSVITNCRTMYFRPSFKHPSSIFQTIKQLSDNAGFEISWVQIKADWQGWKDLFDLLTNSKIQIRKKYKV